MREELYFKNINRCDYEDFGIDEEDESFRAIYNEQRIIVSDDPVLWGAE